MFCRLDDTKPVISRSHIVAFFHVCEWKRIKRPKTIMPRKQFVISSAYRRRQTVFRAVSATLTIFITALVPSCLSPHPVQLTCEWVNYDDYTRAELQLAYRLPKRCSNNFLASSCYILEFVMWRDSDILEEPFQTSSPSRSLPLWLIHVCMCAQRFSICLSKSCRAPVTFFYAPSAVVVFYKYVFAKL